MQSILFLDVGAAAAVAVAVFVIVSFARHSIRNFGGSSSLGSLNL